MASPAWHPPLLPPATCHLPPAPCTDRSSCLPLRVPQPETPSAQVMDFLFEKWKLYGDQCFHNLSLLPPPTGEAPFCPSPFPKLSALHPIYR